MILSVSAQTHEESYKKGYATAVALARQGDYKQSVTLLKRLYKQDPSDINLLFNLGNGYLNTSDGPDSAVIYLQKALDLMPETDRQSVFGADLNLLLGKSYQLTGQPARALEVYRTYEALLSADASPGLRAELIREQAVCENALESMANPVKLEVRNMGALFNSKNDDHSPLFSADETMMVFTSRRPSSYSELMDDGQYAERIYFSKFENGKWTRPVCLKSMFRSPGHEAAVSLSADGLRMFVYRMDMQGGNIYVSEFDGETWGKPELLPEPIQSKYDETHISLNADGSEIFFTSNRPGGLGGLDIYRSRLLPDGAWGVPQNMGPSVNTPEDEETPMIHPDGKTLYFSSKGHQTIGGFDIFYSKELADSSWTPARNLGYPINTADDDLFFVPTATLNRAYYSSAKFKDRTGGLDLYEIEYEEPEENRLSVVIGRIESELPIDPVRITVTDEARNVVGVYKPHPVTGKYVLVLETGRNYEMEILGSQWITGKQLLHVGKDKAYRQQGATYELASIVLEPTPEMRSGIAPDPAAATQPADDIPAYTVQILCLKHAATMDKDFKGLDQNLVGEHQYSDGWYVYSYGAYKGFKAAVKAKEEVIRITGFDDAFVRDPKQYERFVK